MSDRFTSAIALRDAIVEGSRTAVSVSEEALGRIRDADPSIGAFLHVAADAALERARRLDRDRDSPKGPLHGVPIALKDNISVAGMPATAGSKILAGYTPAFDADVVTRLTRAGAVIIGKTNCDEFAMGSSTEHSAYAPTRNPWALDRSPGGSSGGSAAAVAAGLVPIALGSDTGGSIRQPASFCGVVGMKPTYGRVSRYGLIAFASSLDQIGPLARTTEDAARLLDVISGKDVRDATSADRPGPGASAAVAGEIRGLRIGVPRHLLEHDVEPDVAARFEKSIQTLAELGATIETVELPHQHVAVGVYYLVATAEASSNLSRYDGVRFGFRAPGVTSTEELYDRTRSSGFGAEVKRRLMLGTFVLSSGYYDAYYLKAQQVRTLIRRDFDAAFRRVDLVALPTSPTSAFRLGDRLADPMQMYLADVFTVAAPLAGLPAISVPCGLTSEGLPVGLQFIGQAWEDATVIRAGAGFERAAPWSAARPAGGPEAGGTGS